MVNGLIQAKTIMQEHTSPFGFGGNEPYSGSSFFRVYLTVKHK